MDYTSYFDSVSEDAPQQERYTTEPAPSWAEQVEMDTAGMGGSSIEYSYLQFDDDIAGIGPTNDTVDSQNLDRNPQVGISMNGQADYDVVCGIGQTVTGVMRQAFVEPVAPVPPAVPVALDTIWRELGLGQPFPFVPDGSANYNSIDLTDDATQMLPGPFLAGAASDPPRAPPAVTTPIPCLRIDERYCDPNDTSTMDSDFLNGQTSPSFIGGSGDRYCTPYSHAIGYSPISQQVAICEEQNAASDLIQGVVQASQSSERPDNDDGRILYASWSGATSLEEPMQSLDLGRGSTSRRSSFLSAPGNLEDVAPSPTPSEMSVTPTAYPNPLLCPIGDCQAAFTGDYRRGNQLRHKRLVHNAAKFPCGARNCKRTFNRQDARLKHRRKHHTDEFSNLKPPSIRKNRKPLQGPPRSQDDLVI